MLLIAMNVTPEAEAEYNAWYDEEHIPHLKAVPGVLCARRFKTRAGSRKYSAVYHLSAPEVQASEAWATAITTPWQQKMRPLTSDRLRLVLKRYRREA
jgi:antibiotic biosynthesis monooxygenase (ABM) superfamily enzyme